MLVQSQAFPSLTFSAPPANTPSTRNPSSSAFGSTLSPTLSNTGASTSKLNARPVPSSSFNHSAFAPASTPQYGLSSPPLSGPPLWSPPLSSPPLAGPPLSMNSLAPMHANKPLAQRTPSGPTAAPNYSVSLSQQSPNMSTRSTSTPLSFMPAQKPPGLSSPPAFSPASTQLAQPTRPQIPPQPALKPPPGWSTGLMKPTVAPKAAPPTGTQNWDDFDPLK